MIDHDEAAASDLDEARRRIEDARLALRQAMAEGGKSEVTRGIAARLERMAVEVARVEAVCSEQSQAVSEAG